VKGLDLRRLGRIVRVAAGHLAAHAWGERLLRRAPRLARRLPYPGLPGPERLRVALEELGGTFIKLGQMLALQPDILSLAHCNALFKLLDRVEPFPYADVERTFREELGRTPEEVFDRFERESFAAASIGQVHRATLDGRVLAVKVRRPTVETDFAGDIRLMSGAVRLVKALRFQRLYWLIEPLSEFIAWTREELDYTNEARYMDRLRANAGDNPKERIPAVLWELTGPRILVVDFLEGLPVIDYLRALETGDQLTPRRLQAAGFDADAFARAIIDNFLGDAFRHGLFHADLHPANLLILPGNVVGYVDFGITGILSTYSRRHLITMTLAYTRGDLPGMAASFFKVSAMDADSDPEAFHAGLARMAESWYEVRGRDRRLRKNFTLVMLDMLRLSRATGIWPERDVIKYIRSAIAIDGLIGRFAPGFDVGRYLEQVCSEQLQLRGVQASVSSDRLVEGAVAGAHLLESGLLRADRFVDRLLADDLPVRAEVVGLRRGESEALRARAARQTAAVGVLGLLTALSAPTGGLGWNLLTVEALLLGVGLTLLLNTVRRLA
jgi:ubiquinone biosynthesis protein